MLTLSLLAQAGFLLGAVLVSARRTLRRGILEGALILYGLGIVWIVLFSVAIPRLLLLLGANKHLVVHSFPESIGAGPVVWFGWGPALVFALVVRTVHVVVKGGDRKLKR